MQFFKNIGSSIHSPKFYSDLPKKSFKQSFGYFFLLILLLTSIHLIFLIKPLFVEAPKAIQNVAQDLINCFPKDLELKIVEGKASVNKEEPYFISACKGNGFLAVIDTKTPYSSEKFEALKVPIWITKDAVIYKKSNVENRTYNLSKIKDFNLNKNTISSYQKMYEPYLKFVGPVLFTLTALGIYILYIFRLVHLLILALIIWLMSKIFNKTLNYSTSYKIGLYAITLGLIVDLAVNLTSKYTHFFGFPFMVTILTLAVVFVNLFQSKTSSKE
jgi:hypothetical protein